MATATLTSGILEARSKVQDMIATQGRINLHSQFPNEFEYYLCALQLVDADGKTEEYLVFPVQPSNIQIITSKNKNISKTFYGNVIIENNSFNPVDINLSGNFGRKFRTINTEGGVSKQLFPNNLNTIAQSIGGQTLQQNEFSANQKTGYGVTKILERIFHRSSEIKNDVPLKLFFYCYAFNAHFLVEPMNLVTSQDESMNMIWKYDLKLKGVAPANEVIDVDTYKKQLSLYLNEDKKNKRVDSVLNFTSNQKQILQNQLLQKIDDSINFTEQVNSKPQVINALTFPV